MLLVFCMICSLFGTSDICYLHVHVALPGSHLPYHCLHGPYVLYRICGGLAVNYLGNWGTKGTNSLSRLNMHWMTAAVSRSIFLALASFCASVYPRSPNYMDCWKMHLQGFGQNRASCLPSSFYTLVSNTTFTSAFLYLPQTSDTWDFPQFCRQHHATAISTIQWFYDPWSGVQFVHPRALYRWRGPSNTERHWD